MYRRKMAIGKSKDGKPIVREVFGKTEQKAEQKIQKLLQEKAKQAEA